MKDKKYTLLAVITISICVLSLYIYRHRQGQTGAIDNFIMNVTGSMQKNLFYFGKGTRTVFDHYFFLVGVQKRNEELEKEILVLKADLTKLKEADSENMRLRGFLEFKKQVDHTLLPAHVIAQDVSADYVGLRIDKGSLEGVQVGLAVVSPQGVVGRILRVSPYFSDVVSIVDPTSNIDVVVQRSRSRGILSGQAKKLNCKLKYIDRNEDIQVDDVLVSSGFLGVFPKGLLVGTVLSVAPNPSGVMQNIIVKSAVDIYRLEEVQIAFPPKEPKKMVN